jgi:holo-[acyl-carrier protein] synthase
VILGLGIDVVEVARIARLAGAEAGAEAMARSDRFLARVFTAGERAYCDARRDRPVHYAARFAAKEAALKALGVPPGIPFTDLEVTRDGGSPALTLHGAAARAAEALGVVRLHLALTHDAGVAVATVVLEGGGR